MTRLSEDIKKPSLKATLKEINNLTYNQTFLVQDPEKGDYVTPCMDIYKGKFQSDGRLEQLNLIILVRGDLQNKLLVRDTWSPTASMITLNTYWHMQLITRQECIN